ncbi:unnamed protein product [Amoebophrya sp. A120]|nr:unnamed protein product [Amoebophrya sp. A120]|eukprot:GSA120T00002020001.1
MEDTTHSVDGLSERTGQYLLVQRSDGSRITAPPGIGVEYRNHAVIEFLSLCRCFCTARGYERIIQDHAESLARNLTTWRYKFALSDAAADQIGARLVSADLLRVLDGVDGFGQRGRGCLFYQVALHFSEEHSGIPLGCANRKRMLELLRLRVVREHQVPATAAELRRPCDLQRCVVERCQTTGTNSNAVRYFLGVARKQQQQTGALRSNDGSSCDPQINMDLLEAVGFFRFHSLQHQLASIWKSEFQQPESAARCAVRPALALLMANLAAVTSTDLVYDPFCGSGSLLRLPGIIIDVALGSDLEPDGAPARCRHGFFRANASHTGLLRRCSAIVSDPPFGLREGDWRARRFAAVCEQTDQRHRTSAVDIDECSGVISPAPGKIINYQNKCYIQDHSGEELLQKALNHAQHLFRHAKQLLPHHGRVVFLFPIFPCQQHLGFWGAAEYTHAMWNLLNTIDKNDINGIHFQFRSSGLRLLSATESSCRSRAMSRLVVVMEKDDSSE